MVDKAPMSSTLPMQQHTDEMIYCHPNDLTCEHLHLGPEEQIEYFKRRYSALLIHLDRLRPVLASADALYHPEGAELSVKEILGHLIDTDREIWWPRIRSILDTNIPILPDINIDDHAIRARWRSIPLEDVFYQLMRIRWDFAMNLAQLPRSALERQGNLSGVGPLSILQILQMLVAHDAHYLEKLNDIANLTGRIPA